MDFILPFKIAYKSLLVHKSRTFLTVIGIVIGIMAVIVVMSAGESLKGLVLGQLDSFGTDVIQVETKVPSTGRNSASNATSMAQGIQITTLNLDDAETIGKLSNVKNYYGVVLGQNVVSYLDQNKTINYFAVSPAYIDIDKAEIAKGRFFSNEDNNQLARVVVLGSKLAEDLFGTQNPVGQSVKIGKSKYEVIGVLAERGGGFGLDFDSLGYLPIKTAQKLLLGIDHVMYLTVQVKNADIQDQTAAEIIDLMRIRHDTTDEKSDDFSVTTMTEAKEMINTIFGGVTLLLIAVAAISLLVGGVGIMNIMYVSVTERTFEIGLRKAIGARKKQILLQFLWEAILVTVVGGIFGIILGISFSFLISLVAAQFNFVWQFSLPPQAIIIAIGFSGAVGLIFGYYPAQKAAKLDPINALRHEQ